MSETETIERTDEFWDAVHADYRQGLTYKAIYEKHGLTKGALEHRRKSAGWLPRNDTNVDTTRLIRRMLRLVELKVTALENQLIDRIAIDMEVLGKLVHALGRLIRIENGAARAAGRKRQSRALLDVREKLVKRIEELKRV